MSEIKAQEREYEFTLILDGIQSLEDWIEDALFEAGCSDATLSFQDRRLRAEFARSAPSLEDAVQSALADVQKVRGLSVVATIKNPGGTKRTGPRSAEWTLDQILDLLNAFHQRATYGAVAEVLGTGASVVMAKQPRDHRHSWVVSQESRLPTQYEKNEMHPNLLERELVLLPPKVGGVTIPPRLRLRTWIKNVS